MSRTTLRIGTRGSALALWQAHHVRALLQQLQPALDIEVVVFSTRGDEVLDRPLAELGGKGLFVREIEVALAAGRIDLAVHSLKDMPIEQPDGLALRAYPKRAAAFDLLCPRVAGHTLETLPPRAQVGTSSLRRTAQLRRLRPDLRIVPIRGNVGTRLARLQGDEALDAVVLAQAGLERLELVTSAMVALAPPQFVPAPAQGCLALEARVDDAWVHALVDPLDDLDTRMAVLAERAALHAVGGDCRTPFAAYAHRRHEKELVLFARLMDDNGRATEAKRMVILREDPLAQAVGLGAVLGRNLLERHASALPRS